MPALKLTPDQIASVPTRLRSGDTFVTLANEWNVHRGAIHYHARGGKSARAMSLMGREPKPWEPHLRKAQIALRLNKRAETAAHFWKAAELLAVSS